MRGYASRPAAYAAYLSLDAERFNRNFMRLFFGIDLPEPVREHLTLVQESLRALFPDSVSWVRPEQFHITIKFLGECDEAKRAAIERRIAVTNLPPLPPLQTYATELFPGHIRVIAARIWDFTGELTTLIQFVEEAVAAEGIARENRSKKAHVTLGRMRRLRTSFRGVVPSDSVAYPGPTFLPSEFFLFESILSPDGSTYKKLREFRLPPGPEFRPPELI